MVRFHGAVKMKTVLVLGNPFRLNNYYEGIMEKGVYENIEINTVDDFFTTPSYKDFQNQKIVPTVFWDSSQGTYRKPDAGESLKSRKEKKKLRKFTQRLKFMVQKLEKGVDV